VNLSASLAISFHGVGRVARETAAGSDATMQVYPDSKECIIEKMPKLIISRREREGRLAFDFTQAGKAPAWRRQTRRHVKV
jgi:hypothetical protein